MLHVKYFSGSELDTGARLTPMFHVKHFHGMLGRPSRLALDVSRETPAPARLRIRPERGIARMFHVKHSQMTRFTRKLV